MTPTSRPTILPAVILRIGGGPLSWPTHGTRAILLVGLPAMTVLFLLTALDVASLATWWELGHWTLSAAMALGLAVIGARATSGRERQIRATGAAAVGLYLAGQILWDGQVAVGIYPVPAPSDVLFLGMAEPFLVALALAVRAHGSRGDLRTFALDAAVLWATIVAVVLFVLAPVAAGTVDGLGIVLLLYPITYLGPAGTIVVAALLARSSVAPRGLYLAAFGVAMLGSNWVWYIAQVIGGQPTTGDVINMVGSVSTILIGLGCR